MASACDKRLGIDLEMPPEGGSHLNHYAMNAHHHSSEHIAPPTRAGSYAERVTNHIGYTILDNGDGVCLLFPFVPGASDAWLEGEDVHVAITGGEVVLMDTGSRAVQCAAQGKLLVVGIDALSRPVYERLIGPRQMISEGDVVERAS